MSWQSGCLPKVLYGILYGIVWILLFGFTLGSLASVLSEHLVSPENREGYAAWLGLGAVFYFVPFGLLVSFSVLAVSKRRWVFFVMAVGLAVAIAFAAALM